MQLIYLRPSQVDNLKAMGIDLRALTMEEIRDALSNSDFYMCSIIGDAFALTVEGFKDYPFSLNQGMSEDDRDLVPVENGSQTFNVPRYVLRYQRLVEDYGIDVPDFANLKAIVNKEGIAFIYPCDIEWSCFEEFVDCELLKPYGELVDYRKVMEDPVFCKRISGCCSCGK